MAGISSDIIRGYNDTMILYLLLDKPSYGYEISKQIKALSNEKYIMKETTLYSAFTRMEKNGYITSFPGVGDNGGKKRTYYSITDAGREYYKTMFANMPNTPEVLRAKQELWGMMEDKYNELISEGLSENEAVGTVISEFGNLDELSETLGLNRQQYNTPSDNRRCLSIEEIKKYIRAYNVKSILIAIGVFLCIISPIFPIIGDMIGITFIENIMVAVMLAVIAIAVGFFVLSGIMLKQFDDIKYKQCRVDYQSASYIQNECDHMRTIHSLCLSIGVALCVMSVIPPIIIDALNFEILDDLGGAGVLCFVGIGVFLIVYQANASKAYKVLLSLNNPDTIAGNYAKPANKSVEYINPTATAIMSVYWSTVSCIYLSISFLTFYWHITWVIWPIAGVIYALLKNVLRK